MSWSEIRYYESKASLKKLCAAKLKYSLTTTRSDQIISCFHMARDYFESARESSLTISPLLLYYGVTNLAKAITLLFGGKTYTDLNGLGESHGIGMVKSLGKDTPIEEYACKFNNSGTFISFVNTFSYDIKLKLFLEDDVRLKVSNGSELSNVTMTLKEALLGIPELKTLCIKIFEAAPKIVDMEITPEHDSEDPAFGKYKRAITFYGQNRSDLNISADESPEWDRLGESEDWEDIWIIAKNTPKSFSGWSELGNCHTSILAPTVGARVYLKPDEPPLLSTWASEYIGIFIMGMIVRYYPDLWVSIISRKRDSPVLAILEQFINHIMKSFPERVLHLLDNHCIIDERYILPFAELPNGLKVATQ